MDPTEYELEERKHLIDALQFGAGAMVVMVGILMMLTIALLPWGLIVFAMGLLWLLIASIVHRTGAEDVHPVHMNTPMRNIEDGGVH